MKGKKERKKDEKDIKIRREVKRRKQKGMRRQKDSDTPCGAIPWIPWWSSGQFTSIPFSFFQAHGKTELPIPLKLDLAMCLGLAKKMWMKASHVPSRQKPLMVSDLSHFLPLSTAITDGRDSLWPGSLSEDDKKHNLPPAPTHDGHGA